MRRRIGEAECNQPDEVCGWLNKIRADQDQIEAKTVQNAQAIEALQTKKKKKGRTMKSKGSVLTRFMAVLAVVLVIAGLCYAAYVPTDITYEIASNPEMLAQYLRDVTGTMASDSYLFNPRAAAPLAVEGRVYYDSGTNTWIGYNGTSWVTFDLAGGVGLNGAYDFGGAGLGAQIDVTDGSVILAATNAADNIPLLITQADANGSIQALRITSAGAVANDITIDIDSQGTGRDIEGTGASWYVTGAGVIVGASGDLTGAAGLTLQNDETITNPNGSITFTDTGGNTLIFDLDNGATSILIDSGDVVTLDWGTVDNFTSMETITFDDAATSAITMTGTGTNNLTISQAGVGDESLVLTSAGAALDAITISATGATSGIDIDALNDINIQVTSSTDAEDILITQSGAHNASIILTADGTGGDAIKLETTNAAGDIWIDSGDDLIIDVAGATDIDLVGDFTLDVAAGIAIVSAEGAVDSVVITSTAGGIDILCDTTDAAGEDLDIGLTGATDSSIDISSAGTGADAVIIVATAGGIDIDSALDLNVDGAAGINITSAEAADGAVTIATSDAAGQVVITSTDTTADALDINTTGGVDVDTTDGSIVLTTAGAINGDITLDASDKITIISTDAAAAGILLQVDGGAAETIHINSTAGTSAAAINIDADVGGITLLADGAAAGDILIDAEDKITIISTDAAADGIDIEANGGAAGTIHIHNNNGTAVDSIELITDDGGITLTTGLATGILINTATFEHKVKYFPISAGVTAATEVIVGGGTGLTCVGLAAGVNEIGSTEGYASVDTETDYIRFSLPLPDDFVDTGAAADLIINFDLHETGAACEINIVAQIYEYNGVANVATVVDDTLTIGADAARAMETFDVLTTGIGAEANLQQGDHLIFVLSSVAGEDDFNIYGVEMIYRCGLAATQ